MDGVFDIDQDADGEYLFHYRIGGEIVLSSWSYKSKAGCTRGVTWVQKHSCNPDCFVKEQTPPGKHRFKLMSSNGRVLGRSTVYKTANEYKEGIATVQASARGARINDRTVEAVKAPLRYKIYAAPRGPDGGYWPRNDKALLIEGFETEQERDACWNKRILPNTVDETTKKDEEYKYSKCNFPAHIPWHWAGEPRYSNEKLISGKTGEGR